MTDLDETTTPGAPALSLLNRRRFIAGVGVAGAAIALSACGGEDDDDDDDSSDTTTTAGGDDETTTTAEEEETTTTAEGDEPAEGGGGADTEIAMLAAGLEVLAVQTYQAAADAATAGDLGEVPEAVVEYVTTALAHHEEHLGAWNDVLTGGGNEEVTEPNEELKTTVDEAFGEVTDVEGAARLALMLEQIAADTYLDAISQLTLPEAIELAGSIHIVDRQHQSILYYVLGEYPVPEVFATTEQSAAA
ncbi:ferritin-like domain-containing protein [Iamia sp.]|uniref:ferritin-like domain-containing protein n=1 Tax=Iamia sp. TaxID=2722710 RepID=UPI002BA87685|nr:ferritin-like domain-containing protein [Iamia sp.]HXH56022.1 ferritin-like domain-containing protein [Iamia sp.]